MMMQMMKSNAEINVEMMLNVPGLPLTKRIIFASYTQRVMTWIKLPAILAPLERKLAEPDKV